MGACLCFWIYPGLTPWAALCRSFELKDVASGDICDPGVLCALFRTLIAVRLMSATSAFLQSFDHCIVKRGANLLDGLVLTIGPGSIGKQRY